MANIIVKKADGTTDITYVMKSVATPVSPAIFRNETASTIRALQPTVTMNVVPGSNAKTKRAEINGGYPGTNGVDLTTSVGKTSMRLQMFTSEEVIAADTAQGVHQLLNFAASPAMKQAIIDGFGLQ